MEDLRCSKSPIIKIHRVVNSICSSNSYILERIGSNEVWLIDVGDLDNIMKYCEGKEVKGVLITHTHFDHIYGLNRLIDVFRECVIVVSEKGSLGLYDDKLNLSKYHHDSFKLSRGNVVVVKDSDRMTLFNDVELITVETPGHDWSCLTYLIEDNVITGDSYIPGLKIVTSFPKSDKKEAECSLKKIISLVRGKNLYPGHGSFYLDYH